MRDKETNMSDCDAASAVPPAALPGGAGSDISLMALDAAIVAVRSRPAGKLFAVAAGAPGRGAGVASRIMGIERREPANTPRAIGIPYERRPRAAR